MKYACRIIISLLLGIYLFSCSSVSEKGAFRDDKLKGEGMLESEEALDSTETPGELERGKQAEDRSAAKKESYDDTASETESMKWSADEAPALIGPESLKWEEKAMALESEVPPSAISSAELSGPGRAGAVPGSSGLKAGSADDNKQFYYFINFLKEYEKQVDHLALNVEERVTLKVMDRAGKSLPNCRVAGFGGQRKLCQGLTYADGSFLFFPSEYAENIAEYRIEIEHNQLKKEIMLNRYGNREIEVVFDLHRGMQKNIPLDILFILDTTGSMGEEIQRLKTTIEIINLNLTSLSTQPRVRFGLVLYKDLEDEYVTRVIPLTGSLDSFQAALNEVEASGGGDTPEDLQSALQDALKRIDWNRKGIRLSFIITDAPPHLDYGQEYTYVQAAGEAREKGIKIFSVGTGGLDLMGEYILRQISQYTSAKYIFLTYGETGESEGGIPGSVSHHTGANYQTDKLEAIIIRLAKEELSHVTDQPLEVLEDYFQAVKVSEEEREETFSQVALIQKNFRILERMDLQPILEELELQLSGLVEEADAARVGTLLGAQMLIVGKMYLKDNRYELFLKLLRVSNGEILSVTRALIDRKLGL